MATLIKETESAPEAYNLQPSATLATTAWQRVEPYIAHRFSPRTVEWIVEGPGEWHPPLKPATISTVEVWSRADEWEDATLAASPLGGYMLPCTGPYRFSATVGSPHNQNPPTAVVEAVRRLAEYLNASPGKPGVISKSVSLGGAIDESWRRQANWRAQAMQLSGAADLLRGYRRV